MVMTDPLADLLTRLRNGAKARFDLVEIPSSNIKVNIVKILKDAGYIKNFRVIDDNSVPTLSPSSFWNDHGRQTILDTTTNPDNKSGQQVKIQDSISSSGPIRA